ncbi:cyclic nucleotide-binding domain-containing protein [Leekyejoonella antrihumi]|uniref:MFS transporter n=1 Tax=Leekyejoonella antrihumi TaxID=1660198 RepID=A0A563E0N6_9MICO|nr:cyclic nucleotide-binding domain-containing protein [Leekyejoonella antrihumi]TWP35732.1 MFS transporter [Leekyejoonella antrihumi]
MTAHALHRPRWVAGGGGASSVATALGAPPGLPDVGRLTRGWGLSVTAGLVCRVAMLVWTFDTDGAGLVAAYGVATTLPGMLATPLLVGLCPHVRSDRLMRWLLGVRTILLALAAALIVLHGPSALVLMLVAAAGALSGSYRPIQAANMPWLVRTPAQLSAANVGATVLENAGGLVGPIIGGAVLAVSDPGVTLAVSAGIMAFAYLALRRLHTAMPPAPERGRQRHLAADLATGARSLCTVVSPAGAVLMGFVQSFTRGLLLVLTVVLALDILSLQQNSVGWLTAAIGIGGLVGGVLAGRVLRVTRLARCLVVGVALWGLPLVALGLWPTTATAYVALGVVGLGNAIEDSAAFTLIPRVVGPRVAPAALGALELVVFAGVGLGAIAAPGLAHTPGTLPILLVAGVLLVLLAACYAPQGLRIDRSTPEPGPDLALVQAFPVFQPLPLVTVEQLFATARRASHQDGDRVVVQGEPGETFYLIASGAAAVTVDGEPRPALGRGDGFGEIALLRSVPRTATVTASGALETLAFDRAEFLSAVGGNPASAERAELLAVVRISRDDDGE